MKWLAALLLACTSCGALAAQCPGTVAGEKQVYWGDLHVHSGYSLDAWGYGTSVTPRDSYAFAKGGPMRLAHGEIARLSRPLDFMAVTDHAEWFDLMYTCTDPLNSEHAYCDILTEQNTPASGGAVFSEYVLPTITKAEPEPTPLCTENAAACTSAHLSQWQRLQQHANEANQPCEFTSFIGWEWSATPDFSHNHRNVIFASENVTPDAIDYMRFPTPEKLWRELDRLCKAEDGCDVLAIPHNTNMGDGKSFDIETESSSARMLRAKYERLVEIHQEKGNSECLPEFGATDEDCGFEPYLTRNSRPTAPADYSEEEWRKMRSGYVRRLLLRGLHGYKTSGTPAFNPLQLGIIGSTDNHAGAGGFVDEQTWPGSVFGLGDFERSMTRQNWNPGGLVAVWAEENTRAAIFAALKRREVYATSGPRMRLRVEAAKSALTCEADMAASGVPMGGTLEADELEKVFLRIRAQADQSPIEAIEVIKGYLDGDELKESVTRVWSKQAGAQDVCVIHEDASLQPSTPSFWYVRVLETPTPRWTAYQCRRAGRCDDYPGADRWIRERAWSSPVWYLPKFN